MNVAGIDILHFDQHLERLGDHLGVESHWVAEPPRFWFWA